MKVLVRFVFVWLLCQSLNSEAANIAVVAPKMGAEAKYGIELAEGAQIAVDMINAVGGLLGEKIDLITVDDQCDNLFAVSAAQMMALNSSADDKVDLVIGPYCTNAFNQVAEIYANGKIIRIMPVPLSEEQYKLAQNGFFKIGGQMSDQAVTFFEFYKKNFAEKNVALVYDSSLPQTMETVLRTQELFTEHKLANRITLYDVVNYNKDYSQMSKEILLNSQVVYVLSSAKPSARLVQRLQEQNPETIVFVDEYLATPYFLEELGNFAEGIYVLALKNLKDNPDFTEELVELRLKGKEPRGLGVYSYAAVKLWHQMVEESKSTDFDKMVKQVSGKIFGLPWGKASFTEGRVSQVPGYGISQIKNGEYAQVN